MSNIVVSAFYHFTRFEDPSALREPLRLALASEGVLGTVLLAEEGINGTIAGPRAGIDAAMSAIRALPGCSALENKESTAEEMPFYRLKVRLKKEIVTLGVPGVDPTKEVGTYVDPSDWNTLIADPDVVCIDTRNDYEVDIGTFKGAINPHTPTFGEFPSWFEESSGAFEGKKIAMFCTGGIRCEKATSYLKHRGFEDVFHLKGGILKYLENVPEDDSQWEGACFVFDDRVAVEHGLREGDYELCRACRMPLSAGDRQSPHYVEGVCCAHCVDKRTDDQRVRYAERHAQVKMAEQRGEAHIGAQFDPPKKKSDFMGGW